MSKKQESGTITKNRAIKIFEALGFKTASKWDPARLQSKLTKLNILVEGAELDEKTRKRVNEILRLQKQGRRVAVIDLETAEAGKQLDKEIKESAQRAIKEKAEKKTEAAKKEVASAKKKDKKTAADKKTAKRVAEKKGTDKFGSYLGSSTAKINAVLSKKPKTMKQLIEEAGISGTHYDHLNSLVERKIVIKSDKGYALA